MQRDSLFVPPGNMQTDQLHELEIQITNARKRVASDRLDISFGELINLYKNKELIIQPAYQRNYRWTISQKTALVESILMGIPIPPIFVSEDEDGIWELVDGLQRAATIISFFGELASDISPTRFQYDPESGEEINLQNKWKLGPAALIVALEGLDIDSLPQNLRINIKRAVCRVEVLRGESSAEMKYELFKRLNSGGSRL